MTTIIPDDNNIEKMLKDAAGRYVPSAEVEQTIRAKLLTEHDQRTTTAGHKQPAWQVPTIIMKGRMIMKNRITRLAAAAAIIIAAITGLYHYSGSIDGASVAWAQIAQRVEQIPTVVYRLQLSATFEGSGTTDSETLVYHSSLYGTRSEIYVGEKIMMQAFLLPAEKAIVMVSPESKNYVRTQLTEEQASKMHQKDDPREWLKTIVDVPYTELGTKELNGIQVEGIELEGPRIMGGMFESAVVRFWVNVKTQLPVRIEMEGTASGGKTQMKMVMKDFQWDAELDASEFEPQIPDDYTVQQRQFKPEISAEAVVKALRNFAQLTQGHYPSSWASMTVMQESTKAYNTKYGIKPSQDGERGKEMETLMSACRFYAELLQQDKDVAYYGDKVTAQDVDAVLMRWKISDDQYRVIFGDLRTDNVSAEKLVELEDRSPE